MHLDYLRAPSGTRPERLFDLSGATNYRMHAMPQEVLFICTGNYYRSRFAEAVFNHHAELDSLDWRAFSRGLAIHLVPSGDLSEHTLGGLQARRIDLRHTGMTRVQLAESDLKRAQRIIALQDLEHRPMVSVQFPAWIDLITFWDVADMPHTPSHEAMPVIEAQVLALLNELGAG